MMMQPYIVDHAQTSGGHILNKTMPKKLAQVCTPETAGKITDFMLEVVNTGTARGADFKIAIDGEESEVVTDLSGSAIYQKSATKTIDVAGKTGTAENTSGDDHSWFVAFAPAENPQIAVAVVLENVGHGDGAINAARAVMKAYLEEEQ
jgi:peptidoglycan glycosyltransferase